MILVAHQSNQTTKTMYQNRPQKSRYRPMNISWGEGNTVIPTIFCKGDPAEGMPSVTVQRQTSSERYVCLSQGQTKRPTQLVAMHWAHMVEVNNEIAEPRLGYSPGPAYGNAL